MIKEYCLGFMFTRDKKKVALILKNRPNWCAGKLNGIGGKIEKDEYPIEAMVREFEEETAVETTFDDWNYFTKMEFPEDIMGGHATVHCFRAFTNLAYQCKTVEEEEIGLFSLPEINKLPTVDHLNFLLPLALDEDVINSEIIIR